MQNINELPLCSIINCYLPALEKQLVYIFSSRKSNRNSLLYGLVWASIAEISNYFY